MILASGENKVVTKFDPYYFGLIRAQAKAERKNPAEFVRNAVVFYLQNSSNEKYCASFSSK